MGRFRSLFAPGGNRRQHAAGSGLGVLALANSSGTGAPDALCLNLRDLVTTDSISRDGTAIPGACMKAAVELDRSGTVTDWENPSAAATPALADDAYLGGCFNECSGDGAIAQGGDSPGLEITDSEILTGWGRVPSGATDGGRDDGRETL